MPPAIPDRWTAYKACGMVIEGTRLICFKVPLKTSVQTGKSDIKEIWDIPTLLTRIPNLGGVIDLTNTNRYYNPQDFISKGLMFRKILIPGREIPPKSKVNEFMDTVDDFLRRIGERVIGVHCTHGLNRTGYLVCRYMRDRMQVPAKLAIKRFEKARGYQIERENYTADILGLPAQPPQFGAYTKVKPHRMNKTNNRYSNNQHSSLSTQSKEEGRSRPIVAHTKVKLHRMNETNEGYRNNQHSSLSTQRKEEVTHTKVKPHRMNETNDGCSNNQHCSLSPQRKEERSSTHMNLINGTQNVKSKNLKKTYRTRIFHNSDSNKS